MNLRIEHKGILFFFIFIALYSPIFIQAVSQNNSSVAACERANEGLRKPLFNFLVDAEQSRLDSAQVTSGEEKQVNLNAAEKYRKGAAQMIEAAEEDGVLIEEDEPYIDCVEAYPRPFPLGLFD